jgi:hypothetical protein
VRARRAGKLYSLQSASGATVAGALRRDALDTLAIPGSPLAPGVRVQMEPPSVAPDADGHADASPARGARMPDVGGAGVRARMLDVDGGDGSVPPAADALLPPRAHALRRKCPRFVGDAETLVLEKTKGGRERRRSRSAGAKKGKSPSTGREDRRKRKAACAHVSWPHTCGEDREYTRQRHANFQSRVTTLSMTVLVQRLAADGWRRREDAGDKHRDESHCSTRAP